MGNGLRTDAVPIAGLQFYGTVGGGVYREKLGTTHQETHFGINVGGGVKMTLAGPLRLRLDYRVFTLQGIAAPANPQRLYAGLTWRSEAGDVGDSGVSDLTRRLERSRA